DTLWQIGKKYYVPVERIKELNGLTTDEIMPGDKLLIVKEFV
ncbi:MAG: LysM peptidoglycan-binding domain-containing protein, partial [Lachnospiraceae bacterium]|nr:LysM peptidoglycan-binding domain-containing protein [Lachnospiraceae bacterium]